MAASKNNRRRFAPAEIAMHLFWAGIRGKMHQWFPPFLYRSLAALLVTVVLAGCAVPPIAMPMPTNPESDAAETTSASLAETSAMLESYSPANSDLRFMDMRTSSFGMWNGIDYIRIEGTLHADRDEQSYMAPFEIVVPVEQEAGNHRLVIEPYHFNPDAKTGARDVWLTPGLLLGKGFSHAGICWQQEQNDLHPCLRFDGPENIDSIVLSDFSKALQQGIPGVIEDVSHTYSIGFSRSAEPIQRLLLDPLGHDLFDLSIVMNTGWPIPKPWPPDFVPLPESPPGSLVPDAAAGRVIVFQTEADVIAFNGALLRTEDLRHPTYRLYEVAGGAHIPAPVGGTTGIDWTPLLRAVFMAGDQWVMEGIEPPTSAHLEQAPIDEIDPVYAMHTGVARDQNLNALGGVRMPDLSLGRGQYIAVDLDNGILFGRMQDLACVSLADTGERFVDHDTYVAQFAQEVKRLVEERFLLPDAAEKLVQQAEASSVGMPGSCD